MIDPRMDARRRTVLESGARKGIRRALLLLVIVSLGAGLIWLLQSPMLSVTEVVITGSDRSDVRDAIANAGIDEGTPLILVRPTRATDALEALPWIRAATVRRVFPDRVEVAVDQRTPVAWMWSSGVYAVLDIDGVVLEYVPAVEDGAPVLQFGVPKIEVGGQQTDPVVLGGIEFVAVIDRSLAGLALREERGELWGFFNGHEIRLGRPVDMRSKGAALLAVLADGVPEGASINLIAPARPAVTPNSAIPSS